MKTERILGVAAILSTMITADLQAARGGGGGMASHGGGGGFARSAPAFSGGVARPATVGGGFAGPRFSSARFAAPQATFVQPRVASKGFVQPARAVVPGTAFARPAAFRRSTMVPVTGRPVVRNRRFVNQQFINQRFVSQRFAKGHQHFDHRRNRNIVVIAGVPYYYPYDSSYYPTDYYSDYDYYAPTSYATTSVAPTSYTYAVAGSSTVVAVQQQLARAGYYHGAIDGIMGPRTRSAILRFERDRGLPRSASINRPLLISLGLA